MYKTSLEGNQRNNSGCPWGGELGGKEGEFFFHCTLVPDDFFFNNEILLPFQNVILKKKTNQWFITGPQPEDGLGEAALKHRRW